MPYGTHIQEESEVGIILRFISQPFLGPRKMSNVFGVQTAEIGRSHQKPISDSGDNAPILSLSDSKEFEQPGIRFTELQDVTKEVIDQVFQILE